MARKIVAGNWKMNLLAEEAEKLLKNIESKKNNLDCELIVCPSAIYLQNAVATSLKIGAQNVAKYPNGAYTGEWSSEMLGSLGVEYCIVGHSERREYFQETDEEVNIKVLRLLKNGVNPIFCCGETLAQRENGELEEVILRQISIGLKGLKKEDLSAVVVAYEPVWAIGTGLTASSDQAQEVHAFIRDLLIKLYGAEASEIPILYGGSCKPSNAKELFACKDIDGGLIGGAALDADSFIAIANSF